MVASGTPQDEHDAVREGRTSCEHWSAHRGEVPAMTISVPLGMAVCVLTALCNLLRFRSDSGGRALLSKPLHVDDPNIYVDILVGFPCARPAAVPAAVVIPRPITRSSVWSRSVSAPLRGFGGRRH